jgi:hypothetical protein
MDLDSLIHHYFASDDPAAITPEAMARGNEQLALDFGVEREPGRKFALWVLMNAFGTAPPPAEAFAKYPQLRAAAEDYLKAAYRLERDSG